jgi:hypothetical protein
MNETRTYHSATVGGSYILIESLDFYLDIQRVILLLTT